MALVREHHLYGKRAVPHSMALNFQPLQRKFISAKIHINISQISMKLLAQDFKNSGTAIAWTMLRDGASALDAIEAGIPAVRSNTDGQLGGVGGHPNSAGGVALCARRAGS